ncbi:MAG TPA: hypothetical protein VHR17_15460 [Thermoanaerobaculia bacterium]|nr:hypothetical protein [Thermoanaerobaculia bacterium]
MKRIVWPLLVALAAAALAGHIAYWYLPRARTAAVDPESAAGALFAQGDQPVRAWLAYPHQNVGAAAEAMDDPAAAVSAAARLAGLGDLSLPAFGPFALPPSDALAIAVEPGGERLAVTIEVFPVVAALARLAGSIADNPVLRGGSTTVSGRQMSVTWHGRAWTMASADEREPRASRTVSTEEGLAFITLDERQGAVEPGTYRLRREHDELVLASSGAEARSRAGELAEQGARDHDLAVVVLRARAPDAMSLLTMPRIHERGLRLPDSAVAWTAREARFRLPGERILRILGTEPIEGQVGAWSIAAMEEKSLGIATQLAPALGEAVAAQQASLVLWLRPLDYLPVVSAIAAVLGALPIAPTDEVERWRDLETVLESLGPVERVSVTVAPTGSEARLGWRGR